MIAMASQISAIMKTWPTMAPFWPVTIAVAPTPSPIETRGKKAGIRDACGAGAGGGGVGGAGA